MSGPPITAVNAGRRYELLRAYAGELRVGAISADAVLDALLFMNKTLCTPPLPEIEVQRIANGVYAPQRRKPIAKGLLHRIAHFHVCPVCTSMKRVANWRCPKHLDGYECTELCKECRMG